MADIGDIQSTFDNRFFQTACQDVLRIVSVLSLDATDVTKPRNKNSAAVNAWEKTIFMGRFFYMVFIKGFTPTVFELLPYWFWKLLTILIFLYRLLLLPYWLRLTGYGRYTDWSDIGSKQPPKNAPEAKPLKKVPLTKETQLSKVDFGDPDYEKFIARLYKFTTHLSPHSQSPGNPLTIEAGAFPGNFFDHLTGVYKILLAWQQPQYVVRSGLFHSVYGTFDYRYSLYDLRDGREPLRALIGAGAEELSFAICTSDRIGLLHRLALEMYGHDATLAMDGSAVTMDWLYGTHTAGTGSKTTATASEASGAAQEGKAEETTPAAATAAGAATTGNVYPKLISVLGPEGFAVRNHITQEMHHLPPDLFAQFGMVMLADFMEQGVVAVGAADSDECMFQFMRFRFWTDFVRFISPYLRVVPPVFVKYMGVGGGSNEHTDYIEPTREEVVSFKKLWKALMYKFDDFAKLENKPADAEFQFAVGVSGSVEKDLALASDMMQKYPYLAEPFIAMAAMISKKEKIGKQSRSSLAKTGLQRLEEWGMLSVKSGGVHGMKEVLHLIKTLTNN